MKPPKPRKKQMYPELWYRPDIDCIYLARLPPRLPQYISTFEARKRDIDHDWNTPYFDSSIFRLKGKERELWGKFEFIGEIK